MPNLLVARGTGNITSTQIFPDVDNKLYLLDSNKAPLTALISQLNKADTHRPKFEWFEDAFQASYDTILFSTGYNTSATSLTVSNASYYTINDIVQNSRTKEVMRVNSVGASTVEFVRGVGETAAAAITDADVLWFMGSAYAEGAGSQAANSTNAANVFNYCQIFRTPLEVTETLNATDLWTGQDLPTQQKKKGVEHSQNIERAFWFGERAEDTSGTHPRRMTRGLLKFLTTNVTAAGGTLTEATFESFLRSGFRYGSRTKYLFASRLLLSVISQFAQGKLKTDTSQNKYGIAITEYLSPHGTVKLIGHDMFEGAVGTPKAYSGYGALIDLEEIKYRPLQGRDTRLKMNIQNADSDTVKHEYITEVGLQVMNEKNHAVLTGVTG